VVKEIVKLLQTGGQRELLIGRGKRKRGEENWSVEFTFSDMGAS
jgi:hypothetical protein